MDLVGSTVLPMKANAAFFLANFLKTLAKIKTRSLVGNGLF